MLQNVKCMEMSGIELLGKLQYVNILHVCFLIFVLNSVLLSQVTQTNNFSGHGFCVVFCNKSLSNKVMS